MIRGRVVYSSTCIECMKLKEFRANWRLCPMRLQIALFLFFVLRRVAFQTADTLQLFIHEAKPRDELHPWCSLRKMPQSWMRGRDWIPYTTLFCPNLTTVWSKFGRDTRSSESLSVRISNAITQRLLISIVISPKGLNMRPNFYGWSFT